MYFVVFLKVQVFGNNKQNEQSEEGGEFYWEQCPANSIGCSQTDGRKGPVVVAHIIIENSNEEQPLLDGHSWLWL